ncbi:hypothetical protein [Candidatus Poriferisodalis sp.]|uniref:hypothetical protein n=1 Tax=Candidatus Poriferisodalis sp. TaxID=3101277 RepID=UPI003B517B4A
MCAILDANVVSELWEASGTPAGQGFRLAVESGRVRLVVAGSQLKSELDAASRRMGPWLQQLRLSGKLSKPDDALDGRVDSCTEEVRARPPNGADACTSDDHHIIALAQLSGARLLYTNDQKLTSDFGNNRLIDAPRGKIYSTRVTADFSPARKRLLARADLCH